MRNGRILQAVDSLAFLAVEVHVLVVHAVVPAGARLVFQRAAAVVDYVHHLLLHEQFQYAEDARLVGRVELPFKVGEAQGRLRFQQFLHYQQAVGRRFYPRGFEMFRDFGIIHGYE